jgi:uncharacterized protein (UPF0210 family)
MEDSKTLFRVRTVTAFLCLHSNDFPVSIDGLESSVFSEKISKAAGLLKSVETDLTSSGYQVQTLRVATNPFGHWLVDKKKKNRESRAELTQDDVNTALVRLNLLCTVLKECNISFCALGPAQSISEVQKLCKDIVAFSPVLSCSADIAATDVDTATAVAGVIKDIAALDNHNGLGNFRFCATAACCKPFIPFFPAAKATEELDQNVVAFALGLENGALVHHLLQETRTIANISAVFIQEMVNALKPLQGMLNIGLEYIYCRCNLA